MEDVRFQKMYQDPPSAFAPRATMRRLLQDLVARHRLDWNRLETLMDRLRLPEGLLDRRASQLSGGELQRFALVRLLAIDPAVILADEPTSRLDPITQKETIDLLVEQTAARGCALLLITHDPAIARNVARDGVIAMSPRRRSPATDRCRGSLT
jgi:peptide/nickel transport system ATP-binding protein